MPQTVKQLNPVLSTFMKGAKIAFIGSRPHSRGRLSLDGATMDSEAPAVLGESQGKLLIGNSPDLCEPGRWAVTVSDNTLRLGSM